MARRGLPAVDCSCYISAPLIPEIVEPGRERIGSGPAEAADGGDFHHASELPDGAFDWRQWQRAILLELPGEMRQLLAAEPTGHALATRFLLEEIQAVEGVVEHRRLLAGPPRLPA